MTNVTADRIFGTKPWHNKFIKWLAQSGNVSYACTKAKVTKGTVYSAREIDPLFAARWEAAMETSVAALEVEARRRAAEGTLEPVYQRGKQVGTIRKYSDSLLMFLLKAHNPKVYRENINVEHSLSDASAASLIAAMRAGAGRIEQEEKTIEGNYEHVQQPLLVDTQAELLELPSVPAKKAKAEIVPMKKKKQAVEEANETVKGQVRRSKRN